MTDSHLPALGMGSRLDAPPVAGGLREFFRYHGVWAPGVRMFRTIRFRSKALLISAVFLLPIALLAWNYFGAQAAAIEFSAKERVGVVYARALMPMIKLQQQQALVAVWAAGKGSAVAADQALPAELAAQQARLAEVQKRLGSELGTAAAWSALEHGAAAGAAGGDVDAVFGAHVAHLQLLLDLLGVATDGSNLTLDPDIDTYYLMDAAMFRLPAMLEATAQARSLGAAMLDSGKATPLQVRRVVEASTLLASNLAALQAGLGKAQAYNPDVNAATRADAAQAAVRSFLKQLDATLLSAQGTQGDTAAHMAAANAAMDEMVLLAERASTKLDALVAQRVDRMVLARDLTAGVLVVALLLAMYLFISFRMVLEGGLKAVAFHIDAMRDGDLTTSPHAWGADEVAALMETLSQMQQSLRHIVGLVRGSSDSIVSASTEISSGAQDLSARTEQSAANLEETASAMEQIASTVRSNEETVAEATRLATTNAQAAERGGQIIGKVVSTMQDINSASSRIGDIIGTIDGIAFQTNILALNAAVEAARAGEQGRGFAVVASEVRALAQRSAAAAREIKTLITGSIEQVEGGVRVVQQAGTAMHDMVGGARRVSELLAEVAVGAREQTQGVAQTARAVQDLDNATQQNAALVEQTAAAAGSLNQQAHDLAGEVSRFKLPMV